MYHTIFNSFASYSRLPTRLFLARTHTTARPPLESRAAALDREVRDLLKEMNKRECLARGQHCRSTGWLGGSTECQHNAIQVMAFVLAFSG